MTQKEEQYKDLMHYSPGTKNTHQSDMILYDTDVLERVLNDIKYVEGKATLRMWIKNELKIRSKLKIDAPRKMNKTIWAEIWANEWDKARKLINPWAVVVALVIMLAVPVQSHAKLIDYGLMKCTAYCPCYECSLHWGRQTYSGKTATAGRTIAVDPSVIDIGSKVKIGDHIYVAEDVGAAVVGDTIDIFFDTHEEVEAFNDGKGILHEHCWVVK